jgi:integrase
LRAGIPAVNDERGKPHFVSANDLRRTSATWLADHLADKGSGPDKSAIEIIADHLGHVGIEVARAIYDRGANARIAKADAALGEVWQRIGPKPAPPPPGVVPFTKRKAG